MLFHKERDKGYWRWFRDHQGTSLDSYHCPQGKALHSKDGPATLVSVGQEDPAPSQWGGTKAVSSLDRATPDSQRGRLPHRAVRGSASTLVGLGGRVSRQRWFFLSLKIQRNFAFLGFGLAWDHHPFLPSSFSLLECDHLSYACLTIIFWKDITCLISQVLSWREILPQNESYLESPTYLI